MIISSIMKKIKGDLVNDFSKCIYCGKCQSCHHRAIDVDRESKSWKLQDNRCVRCGHCVKDCPKESLKIIKADK